MTSSSLYLWPQEGLTYLLNAAPKAAVFPSTLYLGVFTTPWATVEGYGYGNINVTLNSGTYPVIELAAISGIGYQRYALTSGNWGAPVAGTTTIGANVINVMQSVYNAAQTYTSTSGSWANINGIFVATTSGVGTISNQVGATGTTVLWYAPFADVGTITVASGDSLAVTPTWATAPYPV